MQGALAEAPGDVAEVTPTRARNASPSPVGSRTRRGSVPTRRFSLLQLRAENPDSARTLVAAARARGTGLRFVNVPTGHPGTAAMAALGGTLDLRQLEMRLTRCSNAPTG